MYLIPQVEILLRSRNRLLQGKADVHLKVSTLSRATIAATPSTSAPEEGLEYFLRVNLSMLVLREMERAIIPSREAAKAFESIEWVAAAWTFTEVGIDSCVAVGVVDFTLFIVREDFVCFCGLFEFVSGCWVILNVHDVIHLRVVFM